MSFTGLINDFPLLGPFTGWQQKIADGFESAKFGNDWLFRALQENAKASSFIFFRYNKGQSLLSNIAVKGKETVHKILFDNISRKLELLEHCYLQPFEWRYVDTASHTS